MDSLIHKINLDCLRKDSQAIVNAKIGEASGRKIVFTLYEGRAPFFVPSDTTVVFRAKKPSGAVLYNNCVVDDGKIEYTITSQTVAEKGVFPCEIQIIGTDNKVIYTPCITLNVTENLYSDSEIESSDEYSALTEALQSLPSAEVLNGKQDKLIAGENITIAADGKTISAIVDGASISMRVDSGYIQYSTDNGSTWSNLIAEADLKGDKGDKGADGAAGPQGPQGEKGDVGPQGPQGDKGNPGTPGKDGAPGVYYGTTQPTGDTHPVWIDPDGDHDDGGLLPAVTASDNGKVLRVVSGAWSPVEIPSGGGGGVDMGITGATVGQIAKITAVDENGVPTAWSPVDMPTGGGESTFEKVVEMTTLEDAAVISISTDKNGNPLSMSEFYVAITTARNSAATKNDYFFCNVLPDTVPKYVRNKSAAKGAQLFSDVYCYVMHYKVVGGVIFQECVGRARTRIGLNVAEYLENEKDIGLKVSSGETIGFLSSLYTSTGVSKIDSAGKMYCITFDTDTTECIFGAGTRVEVWAR